MKKLFVLITALLLSGVSYGGINSHLDNTVLRQEAAARQQQARSLYGVVSTRLQQYYGRTDFKDPKHKTGWYRVHDFLTWVKTHNDELENSNFNYFYLNNDAQLPIPKYYFYKVSDFLAQDWNELPDYVVQGFWSYLGVRYLAQVYHKDFDFSTLTIGGATGNLTTGVQYGAILLNINDKMVIPESINLGIHEGTHFLPMLSGDHSGNMLSELATFYSEHNFSLPVKKEDADKFADGTRDVRRVQALRPDLSIFQEYNLFVTGIILNEKLTPAQVLTLTDGEFNSGIATWEMAFSLLAARNNRFMRMPEPAPNTSVHYLPVSQQELIKTAAQFGFSAEQVQQWLDSPATIIDLGDGIWPGGNNPKESVVLSKGKNKFYFVGNLQRINETEFMQLNFGALANETKLTAFYNKLFTFLPKEMIQSAQKEFPVIVEGNYPSKLVQKLVLPYEKQWNNAIIQALQAVTSAPHPLPQGYL